MKKAKKTKSISDMESLIAFLPFVILSAVFIGAALKIIKDEKVKKWSASKC